MKDITNWQIYSQSWQEFGLEILSNTLGRQGNTASFLNEYEYMIVDNCKDTQNFSNRYFKDKWRFEF